jgi:monovalent cation/proton antiporter MnhG/PhaG subunit
VTGDDLLVDVLLGIGVAWQLVCCLGVAMFDDVFDRLHFAAAGSLLGPLLIGAAVLVRQTASAAGIETMVVMVLVPVLSPAVVIATARAARRHELGTVRARDAETES